MQKPKRRDIPDSYIGLLILPIIGIIAFIAGFLMYHLR